MKNFHYYIFSNGGERENAVEKRIEKQMTEFDWIRTGERNDAALIFCIGGDGALLRLIRRSKFPEAPILGINTGHLGFFQEIPEDGIEDFLHKLRIGDFSVQDYTGISVDICDAEGRVSNYVAINEVVIRGEGERLMHLNIRAGDDNVTTFSGDGLLICTPAGSTAYNYSLGGAIVDPHVDMLQITPMAPVNNSVYRSFGSSIILPTHTSIEIRPQETEKNVVVIEDGGIVANGALKSIVVRVAEQKAHIIRFSSYSFWDKVKDKITG